jgi:two-component system, NarL family, nitrate/nitrite response regulator NarL
MADRVRVLIADDHPLIREALADAIGMRPDLEFVAAAHDGREALEQVAALRPDVAVLDMRMGDVDGRKVLAAIVRDGLPTRVLFLSTAADGATVYECLAAGAVGFLDKETSTEQICDAIAAAARGETVLARGLEASVLQQIRVRGASPGPLLSARERQILRLVADGLPGPEIGRRLFIAPSTVKSHLASIYEKLGVSDRAAAVAEGMRRGLLD